MLSLLSVYQPAKLKTTQTINCSRSVEWRSLQNCWERKGARFGSLSSWRSWQKIGVLLLVIISWYSNRKVIGNSNWSVYVSMAKHYRTEEFNEESGCNSHCCFEVFILLRVYLNPDRIDIASFLLWFITYGKPNHKPTIWFVWWCIITTLSLLSGTQRREKSGQTTVRLTLTIRKT